MKGSTEPSQWAQNISSWFLVFGRNWLITCPWCKVNQHSSCRPAGCTSGLLEVWLHDHTRIGLQLCCLLRRHNAQSSSESPLHRKQCTGPSSQWPNDNKDGCCRVRWMWAFSSSHRDLLDKSLLSPELHLHRTWNTGSRAPAATPHRALCYSSCSAGEECRPGTGSETASGSGGPGCPHIESPGSGSPRCSFWSTCSSSPLSSWRRDEGGISWQGQASEGQHSRNPSGCCIPRFSSRPPAHRWWSTGWRGGQRRQRLRATFSDVSHNTLKSSSPPWMLT